MEFDTANNGILIIEDDPGLQKQLCWHFDQYEIYTAASREEALAIFKEYNPFIVLQDLGLPPDEEGTSEGFACIEEILSINPNSKIIVMTGRSEHENAVRAIQLGAFDFFAKPIDTNNLDLIIERSLRMYHLETMARSNQASESSGLDGVIANSPNMLDLCRLIRKIAPTDITCSLLGESGVGKEVMAKAIHNHSDRKNNKFLAINCASIPENLIESELFGYEKGAFSGALKQTSGKLESTNKGTILLDEIGDMPLNLQAKLLRFLQEKAIQRVGGNEEIPVDVRVICATNKNLKEMVAEGTFREDLYYRICEIELFIPPLRERGQDKILLANYFLEKLSKDNKLNIKGFNQDAINTIHAHHWPGNVRELENKLKTAAIMCENQLISATDLRLGTAPVTEDASIETNEMPSALKEIRKQAEISAIEKAIASTDNISAAAKFLQISRPTLYDMMKKYNIKQPQ